MTDDRNSSVTNSSVTNSGSPSDGVRGEPLIPIPASIAPDVAVPVSAAPAAALPARVVTLDRATHPQIRATGGRSPRRDAPRSDLRDSAPVDRSGPREHIVERGTADLPVTDLVAAILGSGSSGRSVEDIAVDLLQQFGSLRGLGNATLEELRSIRGVGLARATALLAVAELARRLGTDRWDRGRPFESSAQVFAHLALRLRDDPRERFVALFLDARHRLLGEEEISCGSLVASLVHPREVFRPAIRVAAAALLVVHNHPSGDCAVSSEDIAVTVRLHEVGRLVGIPLLDHVVIGDGEYTSFVDRQIRPFGGGV